MTNHREQRRIKYQSSLRKQIFVIGLLVFGVLIVFAFIADMTLMPKRRAAVAPDTTGELQTIVLGMNAEPFKDVRGAFTIVPPAGWEVQVFPKSKPYNARFIGKNGADLSITASKVEYNDLSTLKRRILAIEKEFGLNMNIEEVSFFGRDAVKRTTLLHHAKVVSYDFVERNIAHHIQLSIPHSMFDKYEPVLMDVLATYTPTLQSKG